MRVAAIAERMAVAEPGALQIQSEEIQAAYREDGDRPVALLQR